MTGLQREADGGEDVALGGGVVVLSRRVVILRAVADAAALQKRLDDLNSDHTSVNQSNSALNSQIKDLEAELAQIKLMSAGAIEAAENNRRLTGLNTRLRSELETAVAQRTALEDDLQQQI